MSLERDLDRLMSSHAGEGVRFGIDDMKIDLFWPSRHDEGKGLAQRGLFSGVADKCLKLGGGPDIRRHRCRLPGRNFSPNANRRVAIISFGHLNGTIGSDTSEQRQPISN